MLSLTGFKDAWGLAFSIESSSAFVTTLLNISLATPVTALLSGIVITSLIQSSSATIALVVATVAAGVIDTQVSVFILMGANIGTTITNTIVGLAQIHKRTEFERVVPAIIVDDVFKVLNVSLFFVIEVMTGALQSLSVASVHYLESLRLVDSFLHAFPNVIDLATEPLTAGMISLITQLPVSQGLHAALTGLSFFLLLIFSLSLMGEALQIYLHDRSRALLERIFQGRWAAAAIGFAVCWLLQSSSVTVSLILPLVAQAAINIPTVYYYSIGAALATTCDPGQLLSYLKFGPIGLTAGLVHVFLNLFGALIFLLIPGVNRLPLLIAAGLTNIICRYQHAPIALVVYVTGLFFGVPLGVIYLTSRLSG